MNFFLTACPSPWPSSWKYLCWKQIQSYLLFWTHYRHIRNNLQFLISKTASLTSQVVKTFSLFFTTERRFWVSCLWSLEEDWWLVWQWEIFFVQEERWQIVQKIWEIGFLTFSLICHLHHHCQSSASLSSPGYVLLFQNGNPKQEPRS